MANPKLNDHVQPLPYGTWPSSLTADAVATQGKRLAEPQIAGEQVFWLEARPQEKGRVQIVRRHATGATEDLLPQGYSARSKVHEYGGGSYLAGDHELYFVNNDDQRVYRLDLSLRTLTVLTPVGERRFADLHLDARHQRLLAVCEDHSQGHGKIVNSVVAIPLDASQQVQVLVQGDDFYSNPRVAPDGSRLCWLSWNHPDMPWDATQLWVSELDNNGFLHNCSCVVGIDNNESIFQPQWSPDNRLYFVSDRTNWWNIYRISGDAESADEPEAITQLEAEFATPQWAFAMSTFGFLTADRLLATYSENGCWSLAEIDLRDNQLKPVKSTLSQFSAVNCHKQAAVLLAASPAQGNEVCSYTANGLQPVTESPAALDARDLSQPRIIRFPTSDNAEAHAFFYEPHNHAYVGPSGTLPPVIVIGHGGPTGATETSLNLKIQYWTSRGFAVVDVNYRGSTGYGRAYRQALYKQWGVRDVDDVCAAAEYVTRQGWVHPQQRIIKGSSAGGYTVLAALAFRETFNAGVSLYGIGDLELLAQDTHKFEARYLDNLIGPYPAEQQRYRELSPLHHVQNMRCPLLVFQGLEDKVVPPNQAQAMVEAVTQRGIPVGYVTYPEEGHGFRQADTVRHMLAAEQYFYQRVFGLDGTDSTVEAPLEIANID